MASEAAQQLFDALQSMLPESSVQQIQAMVQSIMGGWTGGSAEGPNNGTIEYETRPN